MKTATFYGCACILFAGAACTHQRHAIDQKALAEDSTQRVNAQWATVEQERVKIAKDASSLREKDLFSRRQYEIQPGDTAESIGQKFGLTLDQLAVLNPGRDLKQLAPRELLFIAPERPATRG